MEKLRIEGDHKATLAALSGKNYTYQGQFFLNAYPELTAEDREFTFLAYQSMCDLDRRMWDASGKNSSDYMEGVSLTPEWALKHFEQYEKLALRKMEFDQRMKKLDTNMDGNMSFLEYLLDHFGKPAPGSGGPQDILGRPQCNSGALQKAVKGLQDIQREIKEVEEQKAKLEQQVASGSGVKARTAGNQLDQLLRGDFYTSMNRQLAAAEATVRRAENVKQAEPIGYTFWQERLATESLKYKPNAKGGRK